MSQYELECAAIPKGKLVQALTTDMNYDPWGGSDDSKPIDWKALGVATRTKPMGVAGAKNKWHLDDVDLGATCGGKSGVRGVYLADVRSSEIKRDPKEPWRTQTTHRVLANLTDLGVLIQAGPASGLVWVTSLSGGAPVAGAKVTVYTPQGKAVFDRHQRRSRRGAHAGLGHLARGAGGARPRAARGRGRGRVG